MTLRQDTAVTQGERAVGVATAVTVIGVVALIAVPLARLGWVVVDDAGSVGRVLSAPGVATAALHSLELAVLVPLLAVPLGAGTALLLQRRDVASGGLLRVLAVLPLLVPQFVLGYSWMQAYGRGGFTQDLTGWYWTGLTGPAGVVFVLVADTAPLCYLLTSVGLATRARPETELAARVGGAGGWTVLRTITIPLLRPVLAAEVVLAFVLALESFAAPQVLGAPSGYDTITTRLYSDLAFGSDPAAFTDAVTLALGLVLVATVLLLPADVLVAPTLRSRRTAASGGGAALPVRRTLTRTGAVLLAGYFGFAVLLPLVALVAAAFTRAIGLAPTPGNWTLDNFRRALDAPTRDAFANSLQLAALAALILVVLGCAAAVLERHWSGRALGTVVVWAFAVPGSTLAVGLLIAYGNRLGGTLLLILLAYLGKFWALAHRTVAGAIDRVPPGEWQAARVSGAGQVATLRTVWLPALAPSLAGAALLVFVAALHEVTMSSLLYSTGSETLAVAVLNSQELGDTATTAALSVTLTAVLLAVAAPAWLLLRRARPHA